VGGMRQGGEGHTINPHKNASERAWLAHGLGWSTKSNLDG